MNELSKIKQFWYLFYSAIIKGKSALITKGLSIWKEEDNILFTLMNWWPLYLQFRNVSHQSQISQWILIKEDVSSANLFCKKFLDSQFWQICDYEYRR